MDDNSNDEINEKKDFIERSKILNQFLKNLIEESMESLNLIDLRYEKYGNLIKEKKQELSQMESTKLPNIDLFSPVYNNSSVESELTDEIESLQTNYEMTSNERKNNQQIYKNLVQVYECMNYLMDIIRNKETCNDVNEKNRGLYVLETQENERKRISVELHDSTVQILTSLIYKSELCEKLVDIDAVRAKLELAAMGVTIRNVINEMREIIYDLNPMSLEDLGLVATVEKYAKQIMSTNQLEVKVRHNEEVKGVLPVVNTTLFRVIQEACTNVTKHANASKIDINITYDKDNIAVCINDNGKGFDVDQLDPKLEKKISSFGLSIMKDRISLLSGTLQIKSEKEKGTVINVSVPITVQEK